MVSFTLLTAALSALPIATSHLVITYPGWRGDSLNTSGKVEDTMGMNGAPAVNGDSKQLLYPFGQQWTYPCGGSPLTTNRTKWPLTGGALAFQPGWQTGHLFGLIYVNLGIGTNPPNMSNVMVPPFQIHGPTNDPYPEEQVCLPQVPLPANYKASVGDNATIQVILTAQHGAALYSCVDITFADVHDPDIVKVTKDNCWNSTKISYNMVVTSRALQSAASGLLGPSTFTALAAFALAFCAGLVWW